MKGIFVIALIVALLLTILMVQLAHGQSQSVGVVMMTRPPGTEPVVTEPPSTEPPSTEPPSTEPPSTEPPEVTEPVITEPPEVTEPVETPGPGSTPEGHGKPEPREIRLPQSGWGYPSVSNPEPTFWQQVIAKTAANFICGAMFLAVFAMFLIGMAIKNK